MKNIKDASGLILAVVYLAAVFFTGTGSAQILRVDSVTVDSVWNSDSSGYDNNGILQQRVSRDCRLSFVTQGEGMARIFIAMTVDSGKTWASSPDRLIVLNSAHSSLYTAGRKAVLSVRALGNDMPGVAFKITARQAAPVIAGDPQTVNIPDALTPGQSASAPLSVRQEASTTSGDGYCPISEVYWDAFGDGTIDDSTTGATMLSWTWSTQVPPGEAGQKRGVIARAKDKNGLWSEPETLSVQFGGSDNLLTLHYFISGNSIIVTQPQTIYTYCNGNVLVSDTFPASSDTSQFVLLNNDNLLLIDGTDSLVRVGTGSGIQGQWIESGVTIWIGPSMITGTVNYADNFIRDWDYSSPSYNITVAKISSNSVSLTGRTSGEVVTITWNGAGDATYTSRNSQHVAGKVFANPASCPNDAPAWFTGFLSTNTLLPKKAASAPPSKEHSFLALFGKRPVRHK